MERKKNQDSPSSVFKVGAIALCFLVIGYQVALFVHRASVEHIASLRDKPDTIFVVDSALASRLLAPAVTQTAVHPSFNKPVPSRAHSKADVVVRKNSSHAPASEMIRKSSRKVESFRFNPNTATLEELQRLGFSDKQAESIVNYRERGGRFRRKNDFAKSFVVSDSVFRRLEPFIDIPKVDINKADSAAFDALPGIGGWFASKMVSYREELGGYSYPEQLMDIWRFDQEKYDALKDLIECSPPRDSFALWSLPVEELKKHPYIRSYSAARSIVLFRVNTPRSEWSIKALEKAGILTEEQARKLSSCVIK